MKRGWLLLLLLSMGLNAGLGYAVLSRKGSDSVKTIPAMSEDEYASPNGRPDGVPGEMDPAAYMEKRFQRMAKRLELTPEQMAELRPLRLGMFTQIQERRREIRWTRRSLHAACLDSAVEADSVRYYVKRLAAMQGHLDSLITETLLRELGVLTPAQRVRYLETMPWDHSGPRPGGRHSGQHRQGHHRRP